MAMLRWVGVPPCSAWEDICYLFNNNNFAISMAFAEVCILLSTGIENQTFGRYCWWDFVPARGWSSEWL